MREPSSSRLIPSERPTTPNLFASSGANIPPAAPSSIELGDDDLEVMNTAADATRGSDPEIAPVSVRTRLWASD
jgi:hypothetical protein